ncbi:MAG TPA: sialidase family protein [Gaiellaceae bacterium]|nr:sialidase family protein [Gaiellaceae bacterium]
MRRFALVGVFAVALIAVGIAGASTPGTDVRLTNDNSSYLSAYTLATGIPYSDQTLQECSVSRGRENEPAVQLDPRDPSVLLGSSNDYCGVYNRGAAAGAVGPIWLGYYRSTNSGASFTSSLVPGYPDDQSPYAALSQARTATAGDPVITWDNHGRAFFGSETSGDPAGSAKTFGDEFVARFRNPQGEGGPTNRDGLEYYGTTVVAKGSSAPNLLGKFNDKTAIEADRTGGTCDGNVYFSYSRFSGNAGGVGIYFTRSTDHGVTFSTPIEISKNIQDVQNPDISVTHNGHVYVAFRQFADNNSPDAIVIAKSTDCGQTFSPPTVVQTFTPSDAQDIRQPVSGSFTQSQPDDPGFEDGGGDAPGSLARDCGDFADHCQSGFTFFRRDTQVRSTADQLDAAHEWIYMVYDATKDGTVTNSNSTYSSAGTGKVGQAATYFVRYDGATGSHTAPALIDNQPTGHQVFPDISADGGVLHALWWDSRNDLCYSVQRPIGNCDNRSTDNSLDVYAAMSTNAGGTWTNKSRVSDVTTNPNYEQFDNRAVPFAGDYLWVTSLGATAFGVWTDWRNTVAGTDPRETTGDPDAGNADVKQCRTSSVVTDKKGNQTTVFSGDTCPHDGGLDQNIYGDKTP